MKTETEGYSPVPRGHVTWQSTWRVNSCSNQTKCAERSRPAQTFHIGALCDTAFAGSRAGHMLVNRGDAACVSFDHDLNSIATVAAGSGVSRAARCASLV